MRTIQSFRDENEIHLCYGISACRDRHRCIQQSDLTDATTAAFFDGTPDVIVNKKVELTAGGTDADGDPCYIASTTVVANTDTTLHLAKQMVRIFLRERIPVP